MPFPVTTCDIQGKTLEDVALSGKFGAFEGFPTLSPSSRGVIHSSVLCHRRHNWDGLNARLRTCPEKPSDRISIIDFSCFFFNCFNLPSGLLVIP